MPVRDALSGLLRRGVRRMPGGRRLAQELAKAENDRDRLHAKVADLRARLLAREIDPGVQERQLPLRRAALQASTRAGASAREKAFLRQSASYRQLVDVSGPSDGQQARGAVAGLSWCWPAADVGTPPDALEEIARAREFVVGGIMLDIGANIGMTSIPRVILGDVACVCAAEPDPANYACLVRNVIDNGVRGLVLPDRVAIGDRDGEMLLQQGGSRTHHLVSGELPAGKQAASVACLTLDTWVERLGIAAEDVSFVKVDTQGWTQQVLRGGRQLLLQKHIVWQIEIDPSQMRRSGNQLQDVYADLGAHFSHFVDMRSVRGPKSRPTSELATALDYLGRGGAIYTNLLLYNVEE